MNFILHLLSAAISSIIVTAIIIITQCRYTFSEIRNAFVSHVKECNNATSYSSKTRHELEGTFLIGFFHPHCSAGGGGERVLWKTIEALGQMKEDALKVDAGKQKEVIKDDCIRGKCRSLAVVIYTIDEASDTYAESKYYGSIRCLSSFSSYNISRTLNFITYTLLLLILRLDETRPRSILYFHLSHTRNTLHTFA